MLKKNLLPTIVILGFLFLGNSLQAVISNNIQQYSNLQPRYEVK